MGLPLARQMNLHFNISFPDMPDVGTDGRERIPYPSVATIRKLERDSRVVEDPFETLDMQLHYEAYEVDGQLRGGCRPSFGMSTIELQDIIDGNDLLNAQVPPMIMSQALRRRIQAEDIEHGGRPTRQPWHFLRPGRTTTPAYRLERGQPGELRWLPAPNVPAGRRQVAGRCTLGALYQLDGPRAKRL